MGLFSIYGIVDSRSSLDSVIVEDCTFIENDGEQAALFYVHSDSFSSFLMNRCEVKGRAREQVEVMN